MTVLLKKAATLVASAGLTLVGLLVAGCGESSRKGYRIEKGEVVVYTGWPAQRTVIGEADAESFTEINDEYGKDKSHVFYLWRVIPNADPATFAYLAGGYSKDKNSGYSQDQVISNDGLHFDIVPNPNETASNRTAEGIAYARDSRQVYRSRIAVEGADPATFVFVPMFNGNYLTYDRRGVYSYDKPIEGADGSTFRKVSDFHFCDKQGAWGLSLGRETHWVPMATVDVATFTGIGKNYAKDKQHVYYGIDTIKGADPATFEETGYLTGKDKNGLYSSGYRATDKN